MGNRPIPTQTRFSIFIESFNVRVERELRGQTLHIQKSNVRSKVGAMLVFHVEKESFKRSRYAKMYLSSFVT